MGVERFVWDGGGGIRGLGFKAVVFLFDFWVK